MVAPVVREARRRPEQLDRLASVRADHVGLLLQHRLRFGHAGDPPHVASSCAGKPCGPRACSCSCMFAHEVAAQLRDASGSGSCPRSGRRTAAPRRRPGRAPRAAPARAPPARAAVPGRSAGCSTAPSSLVGLPARSARAAGRAWPRCGLDRTPEPPVAQLEHPVGERRRLWIVRRPSSIGDRALADRPPATARALPGCAGCRGCPSARRRARASVPSTAPARSSPLALAHRELLGAAAAGARRAPGARSRGTTVPRRRARSVVSHSFSAAFSTTSPPAQQIDVLGDVAQLVQPVARRVLLGERGDLAAVDEHRAAVGRAAAPRSASPASTCPSPTARTAPRARRPRSRASPRRPPGRAHPRPTR